MVSSSFTSHRLTATRRIAWALLLGAIATAPPTQADESTRPSPPATVDIPAHGVPWLTPSGTLFGRDPDAPCCEGYWAPPNEDGTGPSDLAGAPYHSYSFFVTAAGTYVITSGSGDPDSPVDWRGLVALYGPPFDPARPLQSLIAVDYFDVGVEPAARLEALLMPGVVYRVVTSSVEDEANFYPYSTRIEGPTEPEVGGNHLFTSACYPIGDELDFHDDDRSGFAVQRARFCVEADWATTRGESGVARAVPYRTDESVLFWFFAPHNWELQVKVLDGCSINGHFWVSYSANTSVELDIRVFGRGVNHGNPALVRSYHEEQGHRAGGRIDTTAFRCEEVRSEYGPTEPRDEGFFLTRPARAARASLEVLRRER